MKKKIIISLFFIIIFMLMITVISFINLHIQYENALYAFKIQDSDLPDDFDKLINEKYGVSDYAVVKEDIRVDIEKSIAEKYYIKYSWVEYDNSFFAVNLLIENLNREPLPDDKKITAIITDNYNNTYIPFYSIFNEYPLDVPLYYKKTLFCRYLPLHKNVKFINIDVYYNGEIYSIKEVPVQ